MRSELNHQKGVRTEIRKKEKGIIGKSSWRNEKRRCKTKELNFRKCKLAGEREQKEWEKDFLLFFCVAFTLLVESDYFFSSIILFERQSLQRSVERENSWWGGRGGGGLVEVVAAVTLRERQIFLLSVVTDLMITHECAPPVALVASEKVIGIFNFL